MMIEDILLCFCVAGIAFIALAFAYAIALPYPPNQANTVYIFTNRSEIAKLTGFFGSDGCAHRNGSGYVVMVDKGNPLSSIILRHENCHVKYYKLGIDFSEDQCYLEMWQR